MKTLRSILVLGALASLSGCALLQSLLAGAFQKPTFNFKTAKLENASLQGATVDLVYTIQNPNPVGLNIAEVDYRLSVEGHPVVAGQPPAGLEIPANGSADVALPANIKFADIEPLVTTFLDKDTASYRAEGHLGVSSPIGTLTFPLEHEGQFDVPKLPRVEVRRPRVISMGFGSASFEIPLTVTNPNKFDIPIDALAGALEIAGARVGDVNNVEIGRLAAGGSKDITVPVTVHLGELGTALEAIMAGTPTRLGFKGAVTSGGFSVPVHFTKDVSFQR